MKLEKLDSKQMPQVVILGVLCAGVLGYGGYEFLGKSSGAPANPPPATPKSGGSTLAVAKQENGHFVARETPVTLGDTVGNTYAISEGLKAGDRVIVSSTQFLVNGMPVLPLGA